MIKKNENLKPKIDNSKKVSKNDSNEYVEVEIEKNFFFKTRNHDKARLEKWQIGRRNFP